MDTVSVDPMTIRSVGKTTPRLLHEAGKVEEELEGFIRVYFLVFMFRLASEINSVIAAVGYRLAPEHRLPVAYDDCFSAVEWVRQQAAAGVMSVQAQNPKEPQETW